MALYRIKIFKTWKAIRNSLILIILLSVSFGVLFGDGNGILGSGPGGQHGYFHQQMAAIQHWLCGTIFLLIICLFCTDPFLNRFPGMDKKHKYLPPFDFSRPGHPEDEGSALLEDQTNTEEEDPEEMDLLEEEAFCGFNTGG